MRVLVALCLALVALVVRAHKPSDSKVVFVGGSTAIALVAMLWTVERVFDLELGLI